MPAGQRLRKKDSGKRRLGDNSIELFAVIDRIILEYDLEPYTRSTFLVRVYDILRQYGSSLSWSGDHHGVQMNSLLARRVGAGVQSPLHRVEGHIFATVKPSSS